jgi:Bacterial Ig-like domain (group 3)/FG-GAP-like repeat
MISVTDSQSVLLRRGFSRKTFLRAFVAPALLVVWATLGLPRAWATAAPTTTTLTVTNASSDVTSVTAGTVVILTATVVSGSTPVNPGQVKFCDAAVAHCEDSALLATAQLTSAGTATFKFRPGIGSHTYQAVFVGTSGYEKSTSTTADLTVTGLYPTTTTMASSGSPGSYTLTATVSGTGSSTLSPTGDVSFLDTTNGNGSLGSALLGTAILENSFAGSSPNIGCGNSVAVGDFNGDGILDVAVVSNPLGVSLGTLKVSLGNGDGTFTFKSPVSVVTSPDFVAVGDFNGDGILDLAVANNTNPGSVTVFLGNGDGTFTLKSSPSVGNNPISIAVGDFNGDGILDLAVADSSDNTVTMLLGNGDGTFILKSSPTVGNGPDSVAVGDFNGDGIPDLAVANQKDDTATVLLGKGDGTFTTKSTPAVGPGPTSIAVADFNGDGKPDLAVANCAGSCEGNGGNTRGAVTVLLGNGNGTFTFKSSPGAGYYHLTIVVSDFNEDRIPDLAVLGFGLFTELLGNGDGTFTNKPDSLVSLSASSLAVGDFNGDGAPDLLILDGAYGTAALLLDQFTETVAATLNDVSLAGGEIHQIEASYPGNVNYASSASSAVPLLAAQIETTLNLSSSVTSPIAGNQITLTATLSPYSLGTFTTIGETVTFYNRGTIIGTGTLSSGVATLNISSLIPGTDTLTASYSGDENFSGSTSNAVGVTISPVATMLQLYSSVNPSMQGAATTLTANLNPFYSGYFTTNNTETVTFYNGATSLGTASLLTGVATLTVSSLPDGIDTLTAVYTSDSVFSTATSNSVRQAVNVPFPPIPNFLVTVTTDTTTGVASNCTGAHTPNCSLRDALAAAFAAGSGNITFDPTVFATPQTVAGGQNIPPHTTITGPTTGGGATLTNLVTVSGGGTVFTVNQFVTNVAISGLTITGGFSGYEGGGIFNSGVLTVGGSTISGNGTNGYGGNSGGGIENSGTLTLINSTVTGNSVSTGGDIEGAIAAGGGIDNQGTLTITNSSIVGNSARQPRVVRRCIGRRH